MLDLHTEVLESGLELYFIKSDSMQGLDPFRSESDFKTLGYALRLNTLSMIKAAGSGHIGSSFSAIDLMLACRTFLSDNPQNVFFSSKGHDAPGLYAVMNAHGEIPDSFLLKLRRMEGLPGHPEVGLFNIPTSTGSLGMGISKGKGFWYSRNNLNSIITVLLGDGELQEGQIWESVMFAAHNNCDNLIATIDVNGQQIDGPTKKVMNLDSLRAKFEAFNWTVIDMDGNNMEDVVATLDKAKSLTGQGKPICILMKTEMGKGISFMEGTHEWHGIAPNDAQLADALSQLPETLGDY